MTNASLSVPGSLEGACTGADCKLTVKVTKLEPKRGGAVELVIDGTLGGFRVHADVSTFVRDVVDLALSSNR